jgi:very-short-patch-repair endonuclease
MLRRNLTEAEKKLWKILRGQRFASYKFRRQHRIGIYVLDFYCPEARYNLELDGSGHGFPAQQAEDVERDDYLKEWNIQTRRFWNNQLKDIVWIRDTIWNDLQGRAAHPDNQTPAKRNRLPKRAAHL